MHESRSMPFDFYPYDIDKMGCSQCCFRTIHAKLELCCYLSFDGPLGNWSIVIEYSAGSVLDLQTIFMHSDTIVVCVFSVINFRETFARRSHRFRSEY